ncbi:hypothetical protein B5S33_g395 [[Candida] boidinii]|nr:hypothetical protein B5S33_g395 [[Candida] boidinii]
MYIAPSEFARTFEEIKRTSLTHSTCKLVIFASCLDVDAICSSKMLAMLLKRHLIVYQLIPVVGYTDLKNKYEKLDSGISNVILLGCGSMVDLESFLDIDINEHAEPSDEYPNRDGHPITPETSTEQPYKLNRKIYIIDGHRPWNLDNLFGSQIISCFDDGSTVTELNDEKKAYQTLVSMNDDDNDEDEDDDEDDDEKEDVEDLAETENDDDDEDEDGDGDEDDDEDDVILLSNKRKRKEENGHANKRSRKRLLRENEKTIENYYNQGSTISTSSALQVYSLINEIGSINIDFLWLAIVGTTSLVSNHRELYETILPVFKEEVNRLDARANTASQSASGLNSAVGSSDSSNLINGVDRGRNADNRGVHVDRDYSLFLMKHWNLYNSFFYSNYVNSKMKLYTNEGKKKLKTLFARMGIPLTTANQNWHYVDIDLKKKLHVIFNKNLPQFGLTDIVKDGFIRNFGFHGSISANDYVEAITALLEFDSNSNGSSGRSSSSRTKSNTPVDGVDELGELSKENLNNLITRRESQFISNFWKCYDSLSNYNLIQKGLKIARLQQKFIFDKGFEIFQKKLVKNLRVFRLVVLKDEFLTSSLLNSAMNDNEFLNDMKNDGLEITSLMNNSKVFQNPLILSKLGNWILDSCSELDKALLPLVIATLDPDTGTYLVIGLPPKYPNMRGSLDDENNEDQINKLTILNTFSLAFQEIASTTNAKARIDSFESAIIEIRKEDLQFFLERLSFSGLI